MGTSNGRSPRVKTVGESPRLDSTEEDVCDNEIEVPISLVALQVSHLSASKISLILVNRTCSFRL